MVWYILILLAGYLIGSVNSAILLVWSKFRRDVRSSGSVNAGATNVARVYGMSIGWLTLACDVGKAVIAGLIGWALMGRTGLMTAGLGCLIGHCWPLFFKFRGGKGVAVAAGTLLVLDWRMFLLIVALFLACTLLSGRVSLGSLVGVASFPPLYCLFHGADAPLALGTAMCLLVIFQHRQNIRRLLKGEEPRFTARHSQQEPKK